MNLDDKAWIRSRASQLAATDIDHFELVGPALTLRLARAPGGAVDAEVQPTAQATPLASDTVGTRLVLRAGSVGVARLAHPLREEPLVQAGDAVSAGQPLLLLQVGQVLLPVTAPGAGRVRRLIADAGATVGYGSPLIELDLD
ncbi:MAG: biotin/lipoyl-containing protein [Limnohabitans sp.]